MDGESIDTRFVRAREKREAGDSIDVRRNEASLVTSRTRTMALDSSPKPEAIDGVCWK
jgi:hypothetical protein